MNRRDLRRAAAARRGPAAWRRRALHSLVIITMAGGTASFAIAAADPAQLDEQSPGPSAATDIVPVERHGGGILDAASRLESREALDGSVEVVVDGESQRVAHTTGTVAELLAGAGITIEASDEVSVPMDSVARPGSRIEITTARSEYLQEHEVEEFDTVEEEDPQLPRGERRVVTQGKDGQRSATYLVNYRGGEEIGRELVADATLGERVDEVVRVGTAEPEQTVSARSGDTSDDTSSDAQESAESSADTPAPSGGSPRAIGEELAADRGWGGEQFACLDQLWNRESGWDPSAQNPSSGAYGIPQSLPGSKMATAGADWRTNPATQITWGLNYIADRYGTPCAAWGHSQQVGWY